MHHQGGCPERDDYRHDVADQLGGVDDANWSEGEVEHHNVRVYQRYDRVVGEFGVQVLLQVVNDKDGEEDPNESDLAPQ